MQLICGFVFAYAKIRFSHDVAHIIVTVTWGAPYEPRYEKPAFCICENKDADQLRSKREADQRLCFRNIDTTIPLLSKSEISSF